jgi:hypothetical protein
VSVVSCLLYVGVVERLWMLLSVIAAESRSHKSIICSGRLDRWHHDKKTLAVNFWIEPRMNLF